MTKIVVALAGIMMVASSAFAGDCKMVTDRTPCPGKETEALKPYSMKNPTEEVKPAADAAACEAMSDKGSKIARKTILSAKKVTASFDGKELKSFSDKSDCK